MNKKGWLLFVGICGICIVIYAITLFPQDSIFHEFKKTFKEIHHPVETKLVSTHNYMGVIDPIRAGYKETFEQGCDYIVGEVREYSSTKESVKTFYAGEALKFARSEGYSILEFLPVDSSGKVEASGILLFYWHWRFFIHEFRF